jgi:transcriptional regulator with XRE-family HTH domain
LRKRAGMTQDDLAAATGYSRSLIAALERNRRLADAARTKVRAALDPALYAEAFAAGRQLSLEEALARMS